LGVDAAGQPPAHRKKGKLLKRPLDILWMDVTYDIIIIIIISIFQLCFSYAATLPPSAIKYILLVPVFDDWKCTNVY